MNQLGVDPSLICVCNLPVRVMSAILQEAIPGIVSAPRLTLGVVKVPRSADKGPTVTGAGQRCDPVVKIDHLALCHRQGVHGNLSLVRGPHESFGLPTLRLGRHLHLNKTSLERISRRFHALVAVASKSQDAIFRIAVASVSIHLVSMDQSVKGKSSRGRAS